MVADANVEELLDIAKKAFSDAVEIHKLIEILETGNSPDIIASISKKRAGSCSDIGKRAVALTSGISAQPRISDRMDLRA